MAGMAKNGYQDIAMDIMKEDKDPRGGMMAKDGVDDETKKEQDSEVHYAEPTIDHNSRLQEMVGEDWTPEELQELDAMTPEQIEQVYANVEKYDFMQHPFEGVLDADFIDPADDELMDAEMEYMRQQAAE